MIDEELPDLEGPFCLPKTTSNFRLLYVKQFITVYSDAAESLTPIALITANWRVLTAELWHFTGLSKLVSHWILT